MMLKLSTSSAHRDCKAAFCQHLPDKSTSCKAGLQGAGLSPQSAIRSGARDGLQDPWVQTERGEKFN